MGDHLISFIFSSKNRYYLLCAISVLLATSLLYMCRGIPSAFKVIPNLKELMYSDEYYLQYNDVSIDDYVIFHGVQDTLGNLKSAETLLLGSSRLGYAIQNDIIRETKHEPYVMAFGHEEMDIFPTKIILKFDLKPKLIIINIDEFFENKMSKFASKVAKEGYFPALRSVFEYNASTLAQNALHQYLPYISPFFTLRPETLLIRSRKNGTWNFLKEPIHEQNIRIPPETSPTEEQISYGKLAVEKLRSQGSDIIFILIPNPNTSIKWATEFSNALGVKFWPYPFDGIKLRDLSHMTQEEGRKYTNFLMEKIWSYYDVNKSKLE